LFQQRRGDGSSAEERKRYFKQRRGNGIFCRGEETVVSAEERER
jgi:hypothetical protein